MNTFVSKINGNVQKFSFSASFVYYLRFKWMNRTLLLLQSWQFNFFFDNDWRKGTINDKKKRYRKWNKNQRRSIKKICFRQINLSMCGVIWRWRQLHHPNEQSQLNSIPKKIFSSHSLGGFTKMDGLFFGRCLLFAFATQIYNINHSLWSSNGWTHARSTA